jgi:hypothetical protein
VLCYHLCHVAFLFASCCCSTFHATIILFTLLLLSSLHCCCPFHVIALLFMLLLFTSS